MVTGNQQTFDENRKVRSQSLLEITVLFSLVPRLPLIFQAPGNEATSSLEESEEPAVVTVLPYH